MSDDIPRVGGMELLDRNPPMMSCGHAANATCGDKPSCAICYCMEQKDTPDLTGRTAVCSYGCNPVPSNMNLPFFKYRPGQDRDEYYCGCFGWD